MLIPSGSLARRAARRFPVSVTTKAATLLHISPAYARLQAARVARERGIDVALVQKLIDEHTTARPLGVLGEAGVNVLQLNVALDHAYPKRGA